MAIIDKDILNSYLLNFPVLSNVVGWRTFGGCKNPSSVALRSTSSSGTVRKDILSKSLPGSRFISRLHGNTLITPSDERHVSPDGIVDAEREFEPSSKKLRRTVQVQPVNSTGDATCKPGREAEESSGPRSDPGVPIRYGVAAILTSVEAIAVQS
jgi:hypothetical protein